MPCLRGKVCICGLLVRLLKTCGGNSFCFHKTSGKIYYVYEDTYDDDDNVPIECVAPDFLSFINDMVTGE